MKPIVPAIIPTSAEDVKTTLEKLFFVSEIQIDVVDGKFVPFTSWPYKPPGRPVEIKSYTDPFTLEVDLMVEEQFVAANYWLEAGANMLVFHVEGIDLPSFTKFVQSTSVSVGVSSTNDFPIEDFMPYVLQADYVQLMGISEIGKQGQEFDERVIDRIKEIKKLCPKMTVSIDGSVNKETIPHLCVAGADRFVSGSAILSARDQRSAYDELVKLAN